MTYEIPQTTVTQYPAAALQGMVGDNGLLDVLSACVSETGGLDAGLGVILDTAQASTPGYTLKAKLPVDANSIIAGFTLYRAMGGVLNATSDPRFPLDAGVNIVRKGRIWVLAQANVVQGDPVYVWFAGTSVNGSIRNDAGSNQAVYARGCRVLRGASAGGLALIDVNIPATSDAGTTVAGGSWTVTALKTGAYTANIGELVKVNPTAGAITITLPTAVGNSGRAIKVVDYGADGTGASATHAITIAAAGSEKIDGAATKTISTNAGELTVVSDGVGWLSAAAA